jgi:type IV secretory pathway VirB3-like protein
MHDKKGVCIYLFLSSRYTTVYDSIVERIVVSTQATFQELLNMFYWGGVSIVVLSLP